LPRGATVALPESYRELAAYPVAGDVRVDRRTLAPGSMAVVRPDRSVQLVADTDSHVLVIGGDPVGERKVWWNLVAGSAERIEKAKADWKEGRFARVPGETEFTPLPDQ